MFCLRALDTWIKSKYMKKLYVPQNSTEPWELLAKGEDPSKCLPNRSVVSLTAASSAAGENMMISNNRKSPSNSTRNQKKKLGFNLSSREGGNSTKSKYDS